MRPLHGHLGVPHEHSAGERFLHLKLAASIVLASILGRDERDRRRAVLVSDRSRGERARKFPTSAEDGRGLLRR
jgi:hypothetical protein